MATIGPDPGDGYARWVGATLIAEAVLVGISRLLTLVYVVASQVYRPDEEHLARTAYVPFVLSAAAFVTILGWAGAQLRTHPEGAWRAATVPGRIALILAGLLNAVLLVWAARALARPGGHETEGLVAWIVGAVVALSVLIGLVRDAAGRARPTVER